MTLDCSAARLQAAGLAWSAMCCTVWHGSIIAAHRCTLIYLIIIGGCVDLYSVRRGAGILYVLEVLRRCDTLQRGAGGAVQSDTHIYNSVGKMRQIAGKAPVKPCVLFCGGDV